MVGQQARESALAGGERVIGVEWMSSQYPDMDGCEKASPPSTT